MRKAIKSLLLRIQKVCHPANAICTGITCFAPSEQTFGTRCQFFGKEMIFALRLLLCLLDILHQFFRRSASIYLSVRCSARAPDCY